MSIQFSRKLADLRRREGLSQEQLADRLGVTRQSVSKWESGAAMPELAKLVALSELFHTSVDYLVKDYLDEPEIPAESGGDTARLERKVDDLTRYVQGKIYAYDSKTRVFGLPLVSIRFGFVRNQHVSWEHVAKGIIAIGNCAVGVVSLGIVSVGLVSVGVIGLGLALAGGIIAMGLAAFGVVAMGLVALGVCALGVYAGGVCAVGGEIAVGVAAASAGTAIGQEAQGQQVLLWGDGLTRQEVWQFLRTHHPDLWEPLGRLLSLVGSHIQ